MRYGIGVTLWWMGCGSASVVPEKPPRANQDLVEEATSPVEDDGLDDLDVGLRGLTLGNANGRPLVVALHGRGDHPTRFVRQAEGWADVAHVVVPAATIPYGRGFSWFDVRARQDDPTLAAAVSEAARKVVQLVNARRAGNHPVVVTGFSQGGMLSFALATRAERVVDAAVPMGGFLPKDLWPEHRPEDAPPIFAVHGEADTIIPVSFPQATVAHLKTLGWPVELYTEPGVRHALSLGMMRKVDGAVRAGLSSR
ncbi:MAG TPA: hypothetical protein DFR83_11315 [Deltaproteobacteria bacterium]|nr:hypothetical protein [Deltaproteobacteria bacterium]